MLIERAAVDGHALAGQVAVVTGAGQGIGRETARALAYLGATVVVAELNAETGRQTERLIREAGGLALFVPTDVANAESVERLRQQVVAECGPADILVNNAETVAVKSVLEHTLEDWDRVTGVGLRAVFLGIQAFLPAMLERRRGVVVTLPSAEGMPYAASYFAAKAGTRSLTLSLAAELGDAEASGVAVYYFGVGMVETPGGMAAFRQLAPRYGLSLEEFVKQSGGRLLSPEVVATGLVGTIVHATEFHAQAAGCGSGLAKLGLDAEGAALDGAAGTTPGSAASTTEGGEGAAALAVSPDAALARNAELEEVLRVIAREYVELTIFQRPFVKHMFHEGTGRKVEEWQADAAAFARQLAMAQAGGTLPGPATLSAYAAQVRRFAAFNIKQEAQARGYFGGEKLALALAALEQRRQTAERLAEVVEALARGKGG